MKNVKLVENEIKLTFGKTSNEATICCQCICFVRDAILEFELKTHFIKKMTVLKPSKKFNRIIC